MNDDAPALQHRIDALSKTGGVMNLEPRVYNLNKPLVLPRTGPLPTTTVQIVGAGEYATNLKALPNFPASRALIEWAPGAGNLYGCYGQRISDLTLWLANGVPGCKAIWHQTAPDALASYANVQREWMQLDLSNVRIEANNTDHEVLIDLGIGCRFSRWTNVVADPWEGPAPKFDTLLVRTPTTYTGYQGYVGDDGVGIGYSHLSGIWPMMMRGGKCRTFEGRLYQSTFEDSLDNGGRYGTGAIAYHFINSSNSTVRNIACEPTGSMFLKDESGQYMTYEHLSGGCPGRNDGQSSITFIGCSHNRLRTHLASIGEPCFSQFGLRLMTMDAGCVDCAAEDFDVTVMSGPPADVLAAAEIVIDPAARCCSASGFALQAWSADGKGYRETYAIP